MLVVNDCIVRMRGDYVDFAEVDLKTVYIFENSQKICNLLPNEVDTLRLIKQDNFKFFMDTMCYQLSLSANANKYPFLEEDILEINPKNMNELEIGLNKMSYPSADIIMSDVYYDWKKQDSSSTDYVITSCVIDLNINKIFMYL